MKNSLRILCLVALVCLAQIGLSQITTYRYATASSGDGTTFFALAGTNGQLFFMNDYGDAAGVWKRYGLAMRPSGRNNLQFEILSAKNGTIFYALESNSGQLHYMLDFGDKPGIWKPYGGVIRMVGSETLQFKVDQVDNGAKFTAVDGNTGQVYYMFDHGDSDGAWKAYGQIIK